MLGYVGCNPGRRIGFRRLARQTAYERIEAEHMEEQHEADARGDIYPEFEPNSELKIEGGTTSPDTVTVKDEWMQSARAMRSMEEDLVGRVTVNGKDHHHRGVQKYPEARMRSMEEDLLPEPYPRRAYRVDNPKMSKEEVLNVVGAMYRSSDERLQRLIGESSPYSEVAEYIFAARRHLPKGQVLVEAARRLVR